MNRETSLVNIYKKWSSGDVAYLIGGGAGSGSGSGNGSGLSYGIGKSQISAAPPPPPPSSTSPSQQRAVSTESEVISIDGSAGNASTITQKQIENLPLVTGNGGSALVEIFKQFEAHQKALTSLRADIKMTKYNSQLSEIDTLEGVASYLTEKNDLLLRVDWTKPTPEVFLLMRGNFLIYRPRLNTSLAIKYFFKRKTRWSAERYDCKFL
ncbi:MAG: hypothetical protein M3Q99_01690, partial [Acidobacteriota bacterium]|nr:hypothetical protein [Acidobacteriota bacterium]